MAAKADSASAADRTDTVGIMLRVTPDPGVLVVTSDPAVRELISQILAEAPTKVATPDDPAQIIRAMKARTNTIIVTDDLEITRAMRGLSPESYVLLLTNGTEGDFAAGLEAGADDCISRTASRDAIHGRLRIARRTAHVEASLRSVMHEQRKLSTTDELTKVANRSFFEHHFPLEVKRACRYGHSLSLILCDIDLFKRINDANGHPIGDEVLSEFGSRIQKCVRRGMDWIARIGGEEFAIVLPETSVDQAMEAADKVRLFIRDTPFRVQGGQRLQITASFGVAGLSMSGDRNNDLAGRLQTMAEAAMCRSKNTGRDCVMRYEPQSAEDPS